MKKGQINLSFGVIFSIILIVIFISFAFYAIQKILVMQEAVQAKQFIEELQGDIDKIWKSAQGSQQKEYILPSKVKEVCFQDDEHENIIFIGSGLPGGLINHLNLIETLNKEQQFCIESAKGKITITIKKDYGENFPIITE